MKYEPLKPSKRKVTKRSRVQIFCDRVVIHDTLFKHSGSALKFMVRHGIPLSGVINNKWKPPTNKIVIENEKQLIRDKKSKLTRSQREIIMSL